MNSTQVTEIIPIDRLEQIKTKVFNSCDVSENTRREYFVMINHFLKYTQVNGLHEESYLNYKRFLAGIDTYSVSTRNKYLFTAKVFLDGLYRLRLIPYKVTDGVKGFKQSRLHKRDGLNDEDIGKLQTYFSTLEPTRANTRKRALTALLLFQGLRQVEVARLDITDLDLKNKVAFIRGKGQDDKEPIYLHPSTVKALHDYLREYKYREGALFRSGSNFSNGSRLTTKSIREIVKGIFAELGIDGTVHGFRHHFVTKLIRSYKGELLMVSKYSRHRSIQMLEVYNDEIIRQEDLPRFYEVFNDIQI